MRDLARRLLAASQTASGPHVHEAVVVSEKLRISLTRFAGADGFASLLRRALVLARADVPSLQSVKVGADGRLEGFEELAADTGTDAWGLRRRSRSPRICSGCWSLSSANPSRCGWCARLGPTHRWTNSIQESRLFMSTHRTRSSDTIE